MPILEYTSVRPSVLEFPRMEILAPFAGGAMLPIAAIAPHLASMPDGWFPTVLGMILSCGVSGALLAAIELRRHFVWPRRGGRPWWIHLLAGMANTTALIGVIAASGILCSWLPMSPLGALILCTTVALAFAFVTATVLMPGANRNTS